jgi:fibronectin type 3 domain-containing protein
VGASAGTQGDKIRVTWDASSGATGYEILRGTAANSLSYLATVGAVTTYDDESPTDVSQWYFAIKATNGAGSSALSSTAAGYAAPPGQPGAPNTTTTDGDKIRITWSEVDHAKFYDVWRNTINEFATAGHVATNIETGGSLLYDDVDADLETAFYYWIVAKNDVGSSSPSSSTYGYRPLTPPDTPANVSATDGNVGAVTVAWDASARAASYEVYSANSYNGTKTKIGDGITGTSWDYEPSDNGTRYYSVRAVNAAGSSGYSADTAGQAEYANAPAWVTASDAGVDEVAIEWAEVTGADSYKVYRNTYGEASTATLIASGVTGTTYADTPPALGVTYFYWVRAVSGAMDGWLSSFENGTAYPNVCGLSITGGDSGHDVTYAKATSGNVTFNFDGNTTIADRMTVYNNGFAVYDTGCITGTASSGAMGITAGTVRIVITPHCAGGTGTAWAFDTSC